MSQQATTDFPNVVRTFDLRELAVVLIKECGAKEGHHEVSFGMGILIGGFQPRPDSGPFPGGAVFVQNASLVRVPAPTPYSVDAATVS